MSPRARVRWLMVIGVLFSVHLLYDVPPRQMASAIAAKWHQAACSGWADCQ